MSMTQLATPRQTERRTYDTPGDDFEQITSQALTEMQVLGSDDPRRTQLRERVIEACVPLARRVASRFAHRGEELEDLTQVALVAAIKAVDRFDAERGGSFLHYVLPTMTGEVKRHFRDRGWMMRVQRQLQELHLQISRAVPGLTQQLGRVPTAADLSEHLGVSVAQVGAGMDCARAYRAFSLNAPVRTGDADVELGELVGGVDTDLESVPERQALWQAVGKLPAREQKILILRFFGNLTQAEIAKTVGVSQMHVSRLLTQSLHRLRDALLDEEM
jgi:RNA polymerase sigma-B factor